MHHLFERMARPSAALTALAVASGLTACAPLAQAPLVYSSKDSVGLDVSATSTETPGLSIAIGYKSVDAAYVPVAVSQQCDSKTNSKCDPSQLPITVLNANNTIQDSNTITPQQLEGAANALARAKDALGKADAEFQDKKQRLESDQRKAADVEPATAYIQQLNADQQATPDAKAQALATAQTRLREAQDAKAREVANKAAFDAAEVTLRQAQADFNAAQTAKLQIDSELSKSNQSKRGDAYSVFGSFDSNAEVKSKGASDTSTGLGIGKVFSTGLASQYLTEGVKTSACLAQANKAADTLNGLEPDAEKKKATITALYRMCGLALSESR
jgi:hypothetical protein